MRILLALLLTACSLSPSAEFIDALARDHATASINIQTIYGSIMWCRTNILAGNVQCDRNGIVVKSEAASGLAVPMVITPQLSIGAPTLMVPPPVQVSPPQPAKPPVQVVPPPAPRSQTPGANGVATDANIFARTRFADWLAQPPPPDTVRALLRDMGR